MHELKHEWLQHGSIFGLRFENHPRKMFEKHPNLSQYILSNALKCFVSLLFWQFMLCVWIDLLIVYGSYIPKEHANMLGLGLILSAFAVCSDRCA